MLPHLAIGLGNCASLVLSRPLKAGSVDKGYMFEYKIVLQVVDYLWISDIRLHVELVTETDP